ncbi:MAG: MBL fold metallo-hydrolase [Eubacteriaceae bacterium]|nr:MBL fold metallo-hydrolase [Eubacteriaceae bacterium]
MEIEKITVGVLATNCYIASSKGKCVAIDPATNDKKIDAAIKQMGSTLEYVLLTHIHVDHVMGARRLKDEYGAKIAMSSIDAPTVPDLVKAKPFLFGQEAKRSPDADIALEDRDLIKFGDETLQTIFTPGHTRGSVCFYAPGILFSGDTLFRGSIGRTDLGDAKPGQIEESLKLLTGMLVNDCVIYPGHGELTTMGYEKKFNPYLKER